MWSIGHTLRPDEEALEGNPVMGLGSFFLNRGPCSTTVRVEPRAGIIFLGEYPPGWS